MKPLRAAIYARFSSDLQRDRSIDDQIAVCRDYAARHGFHCGGFSDRAVTGARATAAPASAAVGGCSR